MKLMGKVIVVTGAGGGIGGELVAALIARGAQVAAVDLKQESLDAMRKKIGAKAKQVSTHACNIADRSTVAKLPAAVIEAHGQVDGLINCAGIIQPFVTVNDIDYDAVERVMNVNFYGTLYMTKAFLPHLLERPEATVTNFSSMGGFLPVPGQSIYGASKAAVKLFTEGLYAELLQTSVHVSVVFPGATNTNIANNSGVTLPNEPAQPNAKQTIPMLSAKQAAEIVVRGIESDKPQIYTGKDSNSMRLLYRLNPVFATKFIAKKMQSLLK